MARHCIAVAPVFALLIGAAAPADEAGPFRRQWTYASETSAVIYWQLDDIRKDAISTVEWGKSEALGRQTPPAKEARWSHFHRLTGLEANTRYHYRMVVVDPATKRKTRSKILTFVTSGKKGAVRIPQQVKGPPFVLDRAGAAYVLTRDVAADGDAFVITAADVTLDLDGHTVTFGNNASKQVFGVHAKCKGKAVICNGHIVQGTRCGDYSSAVESRWLAEPREIFAVSTDVHLKCAYPIKFLGRAARVHVHHNDLYSRVTELESRHYPGNDLLRLDIAGGGIHVHDNILTGGCHRAMRLAGKGPNVEVDHNDIRHHQQYVNGYAFAAGCGGLDIHHNKVTSCGRGVHLSGEGIRFHHNHLDIFGHQQLDDIPAKTRPFKHQIVELHGIKFEGRKVRHCKVHDNFMRIVQKLPHDSGGRGSPEDKVVSGVYVRSKATSIAAGRLADSTRNWEKDRWRSYFVKYAADRPPALIRGNDATTLLADFQPAEPGEYTIYQKWTYVPATPLNIACYDPNAMNEVYNNTFVALTHYRKTRHGGYGRSGQWASAIYFVGMQHGPAERGKYSIYVHDNQFISNHLCVASYRPVNMTVRIEKNTFTLAGDPAPADGYQPFRRIGPELEAQIKAGQNVFKSMQP